MASQEQYVIWHPAQQSSAIVEKWMAPSGGMLAIKPSTHGNPLLNSSTAWGLLGQLLCSVID
jgi:hypothetical protein